MLKTSQLNTKPSDKLPLMPGTKETDIIFISMDLYHLGRPIAEAFLLRKHQLMRWILQHILHHNVITLHINLSHNTYCDIQIV